MPTTAQDPRFLQIPVPLLAQIRDHVVSAVATFYLDEPDANQGDKPRLDILVTMQTLKMAQGCFSTRCYREQRGLFRVFVMHMRYRCCNVAY